MIKEILKFNNIGTRGYFTELLYRINSGTYTEKELDDFFINKRIDDKTIFDGGLQVLVLIGFVMISEQKTLYVPVKYQHFFKNNKLLIGKVVEIFLFEWRKDESFNIIFNKENVFYDDEHSVTLNNSAFKFKYAKLGRFLLSFRVIDWHPYEADSFLISIKYKSFFDDCISAKIKKKLLTLEEFERIQALKKMLGEGAEQYVRDFERRKFKAHPLVDFIEQISTIDVSAGFDIASFQSIDSNRIDKFIEVKSYSGLASFYWSKNEIKIAEQEQDKYFLYLVNRDHILDKDYEPIMIQNPYVNVCLDEEWEKDCQSWKVKKRACSTAG